jgi:hypothetical protein
MAEILGAAGYLPGPEVRPNRPRSRDEEDYYYCQLKTRDQLSILECASLFMIFVRGKSISAEILYRDDADDIAASPLDFGVLVFLSTWPPARPRDAYRSEPRCIYLHLHSVCVYT